MFNQVSYNVIVERFKAFAAGHLQIQRFSHGQITTNHLDLTPDNLFPWMHVVPVSVQPSVGAHAFTFDVLFCDLPRDKENKNEYQREAISDAIRLAEDLLAEVRNGGVIFGEDVVLREGATIIPFMEEYSYVLTGVTLTITMEFPWDWSACDIPATWTSGGTGHGSEGGGGVGLVLRVNGTDNVNQTILDLVNGSGIEVTDLGDGRVRIDSTGASATWGAITGTLSNQTDLQLVLDTKVNTGDLAAVAFSGDYTDLINTPTIPPAQVNANWSATSGVEEILNKPTLAAVATSGDYNDLINQPPPQGLQDVINTNANLTTNNTISGNQTTMAMVNMGGHNVEVVDAIGGATANVNMLTTAEVALSSTNPNGVGAVDISPTKTKMSTTDIPTGNEVSVSVESGTKVLIKTNKIHLGTGATNGDVLTLIDKTTGEVEYNPAPTGGLTSVGLVTATAIDAIVITGSPLTANGDITITSGGNGTQYVDGNLQLQTMPTDLPPSGPAGGDLTGTYPDPVVHRLHGTDVQAGTPTDGDVLLYHATNTRWQHQHLNTDQVDNNSGVPGATAMDALDYLDANKVPANPAITPGTSTKITYDANGLVTGGTAITAADMPTGIDAANISTGLVSNTEFNYLDGVTSGIQSQINGKVTGNAAIVAGTATKITYDTKGLVTAGTNLLASDLPTGIDATKIGGGAVDNTEFSYLNGVTSAIQTQIDNLGVPAIVARGTAVALINTGATTWTTANLSINLVAGRSYYIEAVWVLQPTFNPTSGARVGFSWSGTLTNFHGSYHGSASEIAVRNGSVVGLGVGTLFPSNTPYLANDIARSALSPTIFHGYCQCDANAILTMGFAAVTGGATISLSPRGSYIKAIRIS